MRFEVVGEISDVETIAVGRAVRDLARLRKVYGMGRWRKMKGVATIRLSSGRIRRAELHWYEAHGIGPEGTQAQAIPQRELIMARSSQVRFAVCIDNSGYRASLERHKIYRVVPDKDAADDGDLRIIDESGEDYLYEAERFLLVDLPPKVIRVLNRSFANSQAVAR